MFCMAEIPYISINGKDYVPRKEYEKIEKRKQFKKNFFMGYMNLLTSSGIATSYITQCINKQSLIEVIKNSRLETAYWGGLFLITSYCSYSLLSKSYKLKKELNRLEKELKNG